MNIDQTLAQLSHLQCPQQVDVTDRVMAQVMQRPWLRPVHTGRVWKRISAVAAAATVVLVLLNVTTVYTRSYDNEGLGSMIAQANDYSSWNTVEEPALNPYEYFYGE